MDRELKKIIRRIEKLEKAVFGAGKAKERKQKAETMHTIDIDFSLNKSAFVKRYASDKSGPKKFTLLLAYLAKGEVGKIIKVGEIRKHWSKMSAKQMLGKFNRFYPSDAKTKGWIDPKEHGSYALTKEWKNVL